MKSCAGNCMEGREPCTDSPPFCSHIGRFSSWHCRRNGVRVPTTLYSPDCVEGVFSELRPNGVLRRSHGLGPPLAGVVGLYPLPNPAVPGGSLCALWHSVLCGTPECSSGSKAAPSRSG